MAKKNLKPVVRFHHRSYVFDSLNQAADAIKFFGKLRQVEFTNEDNDGFHFKPDEDESQEIELLTNYEFRETPKRKCLPAPKRGTVLCSMCESVSVRPGTACESCGTIAPSSTAH
jgi:hypothetical protein